MGQEKGYLRFAWYAFKLKNRKLVGQIRGKVPYGLPADYLLKHGMAELRPDLLDISVGAAGILGVALLCRLLLS